MPPKIPPTPSPRPARPGWRDHEDWIDDLKDGPKPKPPPADGDPIPAELDAVEPCPSCIAAPCACVAEEE